MSNEKALVLLRPVALPRAVGYNSVGRNTLERQRIAEEVAQRLRHKILDGTYRAGQKLPPERALAQELGVNRSTLREALKSLEQVGLVNIRQGDGTRVQDFLRTAGLELLVPLIAQGESTSLGIVRDLMEFRQIIGREVAHLAAERAGAKHLRRLASIAEREALTADAALANDLDFYLELARAANNIVFVLLLNPMKAAVSSFRSLFGRLVPSPAEVADHQRAIVAALRARDPDAAAAAADAHLQRGKEHLLRSMAQSEVQVVATPGADPQGQQSAGPQG
jgi:GntR family transcriptional repressor for pyruvate dehydrogenase complex